MAQIVEFAVASRFIQVVEGDAGVKTVTFTVERSGGTIGDLQFTAAFESFSADEADFGGAFPASVSGTILDGQTSATFTLTFAGDTRFENDDQFRMFLQSVSNGSDAASIGGNRNGVVSIMNDDAAPTSIGAGEIAEGTIILTGDTTFTVAASGQLKASGIGFQWTGDNSHVVLDNSGLIESTTAFMTDGPTNGTFELNNNVGASIIGMIRTSLTGSNSTAVINNAGFINGRVDITNTTFNNLATGVVTNIENNDVFKNGSNSTLNNYGKVYSSDVEAGGSDAWDIGGGVNDVIHNFSGGYIEGSRHALTGKRDITLVNDAGGLIVGRNGSAVNMDNDASAENTAHIMNYGTLEGRSANLDDSDGDAIDTDGLAVIENYGVIKGLGHNGYHKGEANVAEGIAIGGGVINNYAGGTIYGFGRAIEIDDSSNGAAFAATTIVNAGLIKGDGNLPTGVSPEDVALFAARIKGGEAVNIIGSFADTLTNTGEIVGGVRMGGGDDVVTNKGVMTATGGSALDLGAGDDTLEFYAGSTITGGVIGGDGDDTVRLIGATPATTGAFGAASGVENLVVREGSWSTAASDYSNVTIEDGGKLASIVTLNGNDKLTVQAGGSLVAATAIMWAGGGDAVVDNAGLIDASSRVLNTTAGAAGSLTFNNLSGGTVKGPITPAGQGQADAVITLNNAGVIESAANGRAIDFRSFDNNGAHAVINNLEGGIIRKIGGDDADIIRPGANATVNNWGTITTVAGWAGGGDGIDFQGDAGGRVNNYGLIDASKHAVTGEQPLTVVNEGVMIGRNGSAVNIDNGGSEAEKVFVTNRGVMEGRSAELADSDGDAVDVDGLAQILNYGRIAGLGAEGYHDGEPNVSEGIAIGGGTIVNNAGAEIYGYGRAIQIDNSGNGTALGASTIVNDGLIQGDGHGPEGVRPEDAARFDLRGNEAINLVGDHEDFVGNNSAGRIVGGVAMGGGRDTLNNSGSIVATGGSAIDMGAGNDQVNLYVGATVKGTILLGLGDDVALATSDSSFEIDGGDGSDTMAMAGGNDILRGGAGADFLYGGGGDDRIDGGDDSDIISGESGNDTLIGGLGDDDVKGGAGDDIFIVTSLTDGSDSYDGGAGVDTIDFSAVGSAITLTLKDTIAATFATDTITSVENVIGGAGADKLIGNAADNVLVGNAGNDYLAGGAGRDRLEGGDGDDNLSGGEGADFMFGGAGNDAYAVDSAGDVVIENADQGVDTVNASIDYALTANVEKLYLVGTGDISGTGNELDNYIVGNSGDNVLNGGGGADMINGGDGSDSLLGGTGDDALNGGAGDDWLFGGAGRDMLTGGLGADTFFYAAVSDFAPGERIQDFHRVEGDKIDLSAIDANGVGADGDQAFAFLGTAAFTGAAGQLRYSIAGGVTTVQGDVNGDGVSDFSFMLSGAPSLMASDFIF